MAALPCPSTDQTKQCSVPTTPARPSDEEGGAHSLSLHLDTASPCAQSAGPACPLGALALPPHPSPGHITPILSRPQVGNSRRKGRGWALLLPVTERTTLYGGVTWKGLQARAMFKLTSHLVNKALRTELWPPEPVSVRVQLTTGLGGNFIGAIKLAGG